MLPATPSLPLAPTPVGHSTAVPEPALVFHSAFDFDRKSVKLKVVPEPSERRTTVMASVGSFRLGLSLAIAGSFHLVILPRQMSPSTSPDSTSSPGLMPSRF